MNLKLLDQYIIQRKTKTKIPFNAGDEDQKAPLGLFCFDLCLPDRVGSTSFLNWDLSIEEMGDYFQRTDLFLIAIFH